MRSGAALLCLVACSSETGVAVEIHADHAVESVEVFVGHEVLCEQAENGTVDCELGVAWLPNQPVPPGASYATKVRDGIDIESRIVAVKSGDRFEVHLEAESGFAEPNVLMFVGFDAQRQPIAVARMWSWEYGRIPTHSSQRWIVNLAPAGLARMNYTNAPTASEPRFRVAVWGREGVADVETAARCAVLQEWHEGDAEWQGTFIVPKSDPDCDGETIECDAHYFNLNSNAPNTGISCVAPLGGTTGPCVVGTTTCRDGVSDDRTCNAAQPTVCVPDAVCGACGEPYGLATCMSTAVRRLPETTRVECQSYSDPLTGAACGSGRPGYVSQVKLGFLCGNFTIRPLAEPFTAIADRQQPVFMLGDAVMEAHMADELSCTIDLYFKDGLAPSGTRHWLVLGVQPQGDLGPQMLFPLRLDFKAASSCDLSVNPELCTNVGFESDNIMKCAL